MDKYSYVPAIFKLRTAAAVAHFRSGDLSMTVTVTVTVTVTMTLSVAMREWMYYGLYAAHCIQNTCQQDYLSHFWTLHYVLAYLHNIK